MRLAWATIAAIIATVAAACGVAASLPASIVIIEPHTVSISNETSTLAVKVMVNGNEVGIFQPGERADPIDQSRLPSPPWHVVATTLSGRPLTAYDVKPGDVTRTEYGGGSSGQSGKAMRVDLSCGRIDIWSGPPMLGPPHDLMPGRSYAPGDCDP